jgi:predicted DCC family thiol-disulfide oxidoreductase YuxK
MRIEPNAALPQPHDWSQQTPLLLFDGDCVLCNRTVRCLCWFDTKRTLHFASLQSPEAGRIVRSFQLESPLPDSVILVEAQALYWEGRAVLQTLRHLGTGGHWLAWMLHRIPMKVLDRLYRFVAKHRLRWFGSVTHCQLLSAEARQRLLTNSSQEKPNV